MAVGVERLPFELDFDASAFKRGMSEAEKASVQAMKIQQKAAMSLMSDTERLTAEYRKQQAELKRLAAAGADAKSIMAAQKAVTAQYANDLGRLESASAKTTGKLSQFGSTLSIISPEMGQVAGAASALAGGVEMAGGSFAAFGAQLAALGPIIALVAAGVLALKVVEHELQQELDAANARMEQQANLATRMQRAHAALKATVDGVSSAYRVFSGQISQADADIESFNKTLDAQTEAQITAIKKAADAGNINASLASDQILALREQNKEIKRQNTEMVKAEEAKTRAASGSKAHAAALRREAAAAREQEEAEKARQKAMAEVQASLKNAEKTQQTYAASLQELKDTAKQAGESQLTGIDAVVAARENAIAQAREQLEVAKMSALAQADELAAEQAFVDARIAIERAAQAEIDTIKDEAAEKEKERRQQEVANYISATQTLIGGVGDASAVLAETMAKNGQKGALAMFRVSQAAGIAQIGIDTAVAVVKALATLGPIAGGIATAGIIATGAAQAAVVASQEPPQVKHTGGVAIAPDEVTITTPRGSPVVATRREGFVSGPGMGVLGEQGLREINGGRVPSAFQGGSTVVVPWKHLDREISRLSKTSSRTGRAMRNQQRVRSPQRGW